MAEVTPEVIKGCCDAICKILCRFEVKMEAHKKTYLAGDKITVADFLIFGFMCSTAYNKGVTNPAAAETLVAFMETKPCLKAWAVQMHKHFAEYLDARATCYFWS